jgi:hypothetical protein
MLQDISGSSPGRAGLGTHDKPIVTVAALSVVRLTLCDWGDVMVGSYVMNIGKSLHLCTSFVPFLGQKGVIFCFKFHETGHGASIMIELSPPTSDFPSRRGLCSSTCSRRSRDFRAAL